MTETVGILSMRHFIFECLFLLFFAAHLLVILFLTNPFRIRDTKVPFILAGSLDPDEFLTVLQSKTLGLNLSPEQLEEVRKLADKQGR